MVAVGLINLHRCAHAIVPTREGAPLKQGPWFPVTALLLPEGSHLADRATVWPLPEREVWDRHHVRWGLGLVGPVVLEVLCVVGERDNSLPIGVWISRRAGSQPICDREK